jgi:hypothetical protein
MGSVQTISRGRSMNITSHRYTRKERRTVPVRVEGSWNVMAHAQKSDFVFRRNGRVHLNRRGLQFSRLLAAEVYASAVVMLDTPCSEVVWRVLATHSIRYFPLHFPSRASLYAITFQLDSTTNKAWVCSLGTCSAFHFLEPLCRRCSTNCHWHRGAPTYYGKCLAPSATVCTAGISWYNPRFILLRYVSAIILRNVCICKMCHDIEPTTWLKWTLGFLNCALWCNCVIRTVHCDVTV